MEYSGFIEVLIWDIFGVFGLRKIFNYFLGIFVMRMYCGLGFDLMNEVWRVIVILCIKIKYCILFLFV